MTDKLLDANYRPIDPILIAGAKLRDQWDMAYPWSLDQDSEPRPLRANIFLGALKPALSDARKKAEEIEQLRRSLAEAEAAYEARKAVVAEILTALPSPREWPYVMPRSA